MKKEKYIEIQSVRYSYSGTTLHILKNTISSLNGVDFKDLKEIHIEAVNGIYI